MRVVIVGAGVVGRQLAAKISEEGHEVFIIDDYNRLREIEDYYDVKPIAGDPSCPHLLEEIIAEGAVDLLVAVTRSDAVNVMVGTIANRLGIRSKVVRIGSGKYFENPLVLTPYDLGIDEVLYPAKMAADRIFRLIYRPYAEYRNTFFGEELEVLGLPVKESAFLEGKKLSSLKELVSENFRVVCVVRFFEDGSSQAIVPTEGSLRLGENDKIFLCVKSSEMTSVAESLGFVNKTLGRIFIYGGGGVGHALAKNLQPQSVRVSLIESDRRRARELAYDLSEALILHGDGTDKNLLKGEGVHEADVFVAVTGDENSNLLSCLLAKDLGCPRTVVMTVKPDYIELQNQLSVDAVISQRQILVNQVIRYVRHGSIVSMDDLVEKEVQALQFMVTSRTCLLDMCLGTEQFRKEFPAEARIGGIFRCETKEIEVPSKKAKLQVGDRVLVFARVERVQELEEFFRS